MKSHSILAIMASAGLATAPLMAKNEPLVLAASSQWIVDFKEEGCRLIRQFGKGDDQVTLVMARYGFGESFQLTIGGKPVKSFFTRNQARIQFGPAEQVQELDYMVGNLGPSPAMLFNGSISFAPREQGNYESFNPESGDPLAYLSKERIAAIRTVTIDRKGRAPVVLQFGSMAKAYSVWQSCVENLVKSWGLDVEQHKTLQAWARPIESPAKWINSSDYPMKMISAGQPAIVQFRLMVDEKGDVESCYIQETTRPKEFDEAVCGSLKRRAKLTPALDKSGKPMASYYRSSVVFKLPGGF